MNKNLDELQSIDTNNQNSNEPIKKVKLSSNEWKQKEFYISTIWPYAYTAKTDETKKKAILRCQEAGLNLVEIGFYCTEPILDYCDEIGINVLAGSKFYRGTAQRDNELNDEDSIYQERYNIYSHKSIIGYLVWDEIPENRLETAKNISDILNKFYHTV